MMIHRSSLKKKWALKWFTNKSLNRIPIWEQTPIEKKFAQKVKNKKHDIKYKLIKKGGIVIFFNKKFQEEKDEVVFVETDVYSCKGNDCNGWMRREFASSDLKCPLCGEDTELEPRNIPKIHSQ